MLLTYQLSVGSKGFWIPMVKVFLSSSYKDLQFERRAVAAALSNAGFDVIRMEDISPAIADPKRWSMESASSSDIFVLLYDQCGGSFAPQSMGTFVNWEVQRARHDVGKLFVYRLNRPFPDEELLLRGEHEACAYRNALKQRDRSTFYQQLFPDYFKKITDVRSARQLVDFVLHDVKSAARWVPIDRILRGPRGVWRQWRIDSGKEVIEDLAATLVLIILVLFVAGFLFLKGAASSIAKSISTLAGHVRNRESRADS